MMIAEEENRSSTILLPISGNWNDDRGHKHHKKNISSRFASSIEVDNWSANDENIKKS